MAKLKLNKILEVSGTNYPAPFNELVNGRIRQRLGDAGGLTKFGVNRIQLPPGCWSSQRHWHAEEDEFVHVLAGEVVLVTDKGEEVLRAGDCAAFPANSGDGHHLINRGEVAAVYLEIGSRSPTERVTYPDIDLAWDEQANAYLHVDGKPY